jgi:hypothetical protein
MLAMWVAMLAVWVAMLAVWVAMRPRVTLQGAAGVKMVASAEDFSASRQTPWNQTALATVATSVGEICRVGYPGDPDTEAGVSRQILQWEHDAAGVVFRC